MPSLLYLRHGSEELLLDKVMEAFAGKVDGKLVEELGWEVRF
jgi:hypothetical protein